jgi:putative ABC transport system permease protein
MHRLFRVPLAWLLLKNEPARLLIGICGVIFAVVLMLMQMGFRDSLYSSAIMFHSHLTADLVLVNPQYEFLAHMKPFARGRLYESLGVAGVESVTPVYVQLGEWQNLDTGAAKSILVIGFDPTHSAFDFPGVRQRYSSLREPDLILFDSASRPEYGVIPTEYRQGRPIHAEINRRHISIGGLYTMGTSFGYSGSVITSDLNFLRMFPDRNRDLIQVGLINLRHGADAEWVRRAIAARLPDDVMVLTRTGYETHERSYWEKAEPIGFIFTFSVVMALMVGAAIVYQILFAGVAAHLSEFATLKAIGYTNAYLYGVVFRQGLVLAVFGYAPGLLLSGEFYRMTRNATMLPMNLGVSTALIALAITVAMCSLSAALALNKIRYADPAAIF